MVLVNGFILFEINKFFRDIIFLIYYFFPNIVLLCLSIIIFKLFV
jgi:hypothetical protein